MPGRSSRQVAGGRARPGRIPSRNPRPRARCGPGPEARQPPGPRHTPAPPGPGHAGPIAGGATRPSIPGTGPDRSRRHPAPRPPPWSAAPRAAAGRCRPHDPPSAPPPGSRSRPVPRGGGGSSPAARPSTGPRHAGPRWRPQGARCPRRLPRARIPGGAGGPCSAAAPPPWRQTATTATPPARVRTVATGPRTNRRRGRWPARGSHSTPRVPPTDPTGRRRPGGGARTPGSPRCQAGANATADRGPQPPGRGGRPGGPFASRSGGPPVGPKGASGLHGGSRRP